MFKFSSNSLENLKGVHPDLVSVVEMALTKSTIDFAVVDGVRTIEEQREYVEKGVSRTLESNHLPQSDGFGHAVDLVPIVNGKARWELTPLCEVAYAMQQAAKLLGIDITWGGAWHESLTKCPATPIELTDAYVNLRKSQGRTPFVDAPHFQLTEPS